MMTPSMYSRHVQEQGEQNSAGIKTNASAGQEGKKQHKGKVKFCSGNGQYHSENNTKDPKPYLVISEFEIEKMARHPPKVDKSKAKWVIFSTELTRVHKIQREHGQFGAAWIDIDENQQGFQFVLDSINSLSDKKCNGHRS